MTDVRFPTALQLMLTLVLAEKEGYKRLSSSELAKGLGVKPSFVRALLLPLAEAGLVDATLGRGGGVRLARETKKISLRDIYRAVIGHKSLWTPRAVPHRCLVSSNIEQYFVHLADEAYKSVMETLEDRTLADTFSELQVIHENRIASIPNKQPLRPR